jgi:hypothetical protein
MIPAMATFRRAGAVLFAGIAALLLVLSSPARPRAAAVESDLDAFMRQVLTRRDDNWKKLQQYVLDERETIDLRGPGHLPLWGERRDYAWYIRDGFFVRSPVRVNGVVIAEAERRKYEDNFLRREQARDRRAQRGANQADRPEPQPDQPPADLESLIRQTREPQFISSAYFLRFRFDEGRYALVGRETLDGRELLRVEYYPLNLFSEQARQERRGGRGRGRAAAADDEQVFTMMNKASRVTLWVDQPAHQIVKYTFENVTPNFIPSNFLTSLTAANATMTMAQPFPDVWLPNGIEIGITLTLAIGDVNLHYKQDYTNYRQADAKARLVPADAR